MTGISSDGTLGSIRGLYARPLEPDKAPDFTEEEQVRLALSYAGVAMGMWIKDGEVYVPFLDKTVMEVAQYLRPVHQVVGYDEKSKRPVEYQAADIDVLEWHLIWSKSERAGSFICSRMTENLELGYPMPHGATQYSARLAAGLEDPCPARKTSAEKEAFDPSRHPTCRGCKKGILHFRISSWSNKDTIERRAATRLWSGYFGCCHVWI